MKRVIILSGGMDSVTALYYIQNKYPKDKLYALSFDYGSKHNEKEIPLAQWHCKELNINHKIVKLDFLKSFKSSLIKGNEQIPEGHYESENMKSTVVPFRNGIMLSLAIGYAEDIGANEVILGSHAGDHAIYPDCRTEFTQAISLAGQLGTYNAVKVISPFNDLMKWDLVKIGTKLNIPYEKTWSCYKGSNLSCGLCGTCQERILSFYKNKIKDPIKYKISWEDAILNMNKELNLSENLK